MNTNVVIAAPPTSFTAQEFTYLSLIVVIGFFLCWVTFWKYGGIQQQAHLGSLGGNILQMLTVVVIVAATALLAICGVLQGDLAASLLSGIAGYVLGSIRDRKDDGQKPSQEPRKDPGEK